MKNINWCAIKNMIITAVIVFILIAIGITTAAGIAHFILAPLAFFIVTSLGADVVAIIIGAIFSIVLLVHTFYDHILRWYKKECSLCESGRKKNG